MTSVQTIASNHRVDNEPKATIYVRNYAKKAIMLQLPVRIKVADLKQRVFRRMRVPHEDQILFLHGNHIGSDQDDIELQNKYIFHLVNIKRTILDNISVSIKRIQPNRPTHRFTVSPSMKIGDFMTTSFQQIFGDMQNYFLVYTGRQMQLQNTFSAEYVEDQSEIFAVHKIQNLKGEFIEKKTEEEENCIQQKPMMFSKKQSLTVEVATSPKVQNSRKSQNQQNKPQNLGKNNKQGQQNKQKQENEEENDESLTEDIVLDYQQKYSVISKGSFCKENENVHKKLRSSYSSRPARQNDRRRDRSQSPKLHEKLQKVMPTKQQQQKNEKGEEEQDEQQYRDQYISDGYYGYSNEKSEAHDRSGPAPLGLTVISSRHDEQQSLNDDLFKSSLARANLSMKIDKQNQTQELMQKTQQKVNDGGNLSISKERGQNNDILTKSSKKVQNQHQKMEKNDRSKKIQEGQTELYGRTNIFQYLQDDDLLQKDEKAQQHIKKQKKDKSQGDIKQKEDKTSQLAHLETPKINCGQLDNSQSGFLKKQQISLEEDDLIKSKKIPRAKSAKSNNSESMLLETSQDVHDDHLFSGRFAWGSMKNDKIAIDLSAQLQQEENFNEIVPGSNTKHWDHLSFSFRNNQPLELKPGDLIMIGDENALQVEGLEDQICELFLKKIEQPDCQSV